MFAGHEAERGEVTRTLVVVLEEVRVDVELAEEHFGHRFVAPAGEEGAPEVAATQVDTDGEVVGPAFEGGVDERRVGSRQFVGIVAPLDGALAHDRVAQVGEIRVVELDVAATGRVQGGDLGAIDLGEVVEELVHVGVRLDVDPGSAAAEVHHRRRGDGHLGRAAPRACGRRRIGSRPPGPAGRG